MDMGSALQIVFYLAKENLLTEEHCAGDESLKELRIDQQQALDMVEDLIVNEYGEN